MWRRCVETSKVPGNGLLGDLSPCKPEICRVRMGVVSLGQPHRPAGHLALLRLGAQCLGDEHGGRLDVEQLSRVDHLGRRDDPHFHGLMYAL